MFDIFTINKLKYTAGLITRQGVKIWFLVCFNIPASVASTELLPLSVLLKFQTLQVTYLLSNPLLPFWQNLFPTKETGNGKLSLPWASQVALLVKSLPANAGGVRNLGLIPGPGRSPRREGNPLQHSCLENPTNRGAWWVTNHMVHKESYTTEATLHAAHTGCFCPSQSTDGLGPNQRFGVKFICRIWGAPL